MRVLADRPQTETPGRAVEHEGGERHEQEGEIDQGELVEQHRSEPGQVGEAGQRQRREGLDMRRLRRLAEDQPVEIEAEARAQHGHAEPRDMLAEAEAHGQQAHQQPEAHAGGRGDSDAEPQLAGEPGGREPDHGAEQHDAFDAEVEHAGALGEHLAERREQQRRRHPDHGGEEADLQDLIEDLADHRPPLRPPSAGAGEGDSR